MAPYVSSITRPFSRRSCTTLIEEEPISTPSTLLASVLNRLDSENEEGLKSVYSFYYSTMQQAIGMISSFVTRLLFRTRPTEALTETLTLATTRSRLRGMTAPCPTPTSAFVRWCGNLKYYKRGSRRQTCRRMITGAAFACRGNRRGGCSSFDTDADAS